MELFLSILAGIATAVPLVIKLIEYVNKAVKEKNWNIILSMVMNYVETAEQMFDNGAERKEWVLTMMEESAKTVNYDVDLEVISTLIDNLCSMSKKVNTDK